MISRSYCYSDFPIISRFRKIYPDFDISGFLLPIISRFWISDYAIINLGNAFSDDLEGLKIEIFPLRRQPWWRLTETLY